MTGAPFPLLFKAKVKGNRWYNPDRPDRVSELNDNTFAEATEFLYLLAVRSSAALGRRLTAKDLAESILKILHTSDLSFTDLAARDLRELTPQKPRKNAQPKVGDVVAIPAADRGHHLAIVLADDRTGLALGLLEGVFSPPRSSKVSEHRARHIPLYTGSRLIKKGVWPIVGHRPDLIELFPDPPQVYWPAITATGERLGNFGASGPGSSSSPERFIGRAEAEAVGLLDGTYRRTYIEEYFQKLLNQGRFDNGPTPRSWE